MSLLPPFNIVLIEPEIPPNTGNIARLCGATGTNLHLVGKLGFSTDDRQLKRAGLDYWSEVNILYWPDLTALQTANPDARFVYTSKKAARSHVAFEFAPGDFLVFGKETTGLPEELLEIRRVVRELCQEAVVPHARRWDEREEFPHAVVRRLGNGIHAVTARYGFMETPHVPEMLARLPEGAIPGARLERSEMETTYYLGRETLLAGGPSRMPRWRKRLFIVMSRNAATASAFFGLPPIRERSPPSTRITSPGASVRSVMHSGTGQTVTHRLQPTHSASMISKWRLPSFMDVIAWCEVSSQAMWQRPHLMHFSNSKMMEPVEQSGATSFTKRLIDSVGMLKSAARVCSSHSPLHPQVRQACGWLERMSSSVERRTSTISRSCVVISIWFSSGVQQARSVRPVACSAAMRLASGTDTAKAGMRGTPSS